MPSVWEGEFGPNLTQCPWAEVYPRSKCHLDQSSRLATKAHNRYAPKIGGGAVPLSGVGSWAPSNNVAWAEVYIRTKWHLDSSSRLATTDIVRPKIGRCAPLAGNWVPI